MPRRVLYYALGGGLGHLVRGAAFLHEKDLAGCATLLSASPRLHDPRINRGIATLQVPLQLQDDASSLRSWLAQVIASEQPDLLCVDCFPGGILGELCDVPALDGIELWHLARLLRWPDYAPLLHGRPPRFTRSFRLEPLHPEHEAFLQAQSDRLEDLLLNTPGSTDHAVGPKAAPFWLVLHSGPEQEVAELLAYAVDMRQIEAEKVQIIVASGHPPATLPSACSSVDAHPATALIAAATRIFSAAGFNVLRETAAHRHKQVIVPFPRRFDDQYERARRAR